MALNVMLHPLPTQTPPFHPASSDRVPQSCESERTEEEVNKESTGQWWPNTSGVKMREVQQTLSVTLQQIPVCFIQPVMPQALISEGQLAPTGLGWPSTSINNNRKWCFVHLIYVTDAAVDKPRELQGLQAERNKTSGVWWYPSSVFVCSYLCLHFPNFCWRTVPSLTYCAY